MGTRIPLNREAEAQRSGEIHPRSPQQPISEMRPDPGLLDAMCSPSPLSESTCGSLDSKKKVPLGWRHPVRGRGVDEMTAQSLKRAGLGCE